MSEWTKQLFCKHKWRYIGTIGWFRCVNADIYCCEKCGKFKEKIEKIRW